MLGAIGTRLLAISLEQGEDETAVLRQLAARSARAKYPWRDRFDVLSKNLLGATPVVFLFDNFEDNLTDGALCRRTGGAAGPLAAGAAA